MKVLTILLLVSLASCSRPSLSFCIDLTDRVLCEEQLERQLRQISDELSDEENEKLLELLGLLDNENTIQKTVSIHSPKFEEVAPISSNLVHFQSLPVFAPNCIFDEPIELMGTDFGANCIVERMTGGVAAGDFDGDGWTDLFFTQAMVRNGVSKISKDINSFDVTTKFGLSKGLRSSGASTNGALWFDADNDGDLDLYVTTVGGNRHLLFINQMNNSNTKQNNSNTKQKIPHFIELGLERNATAILEDDSSLTSGVSIATADYDGDGYLDLYVTEWRFYFMLNVEQLIISRNLKTWRWSNSRLLRNLGKQAPGYFEDTTSSAGVDIEGYSRRINIFSFTPVFADFDNDDWPDLFIAADFGTSAIFWNNGNGTFIEGTRDSGLGFERNGMGVAVADFDQDGLLDIFVTSIYGNEDLQERDFTSYFELSGNVMYRNLGNRKFSHFDQKNILFMNLSIICFIVVGVGVLLGLMQTMMAF
eukprot:GSMAST32.ASY1.ANO1.2318.1 assembled CDS